MKKAFSNLKRKSIWNNPHNRPRGKARVTCVPRMKAPLQYLRDVAALLEDTAEIDPMLTDKAVYAKSVLDSAKWNAKHGFGSEVRLMANSTYLWVKRQGLAI